MLFKTIITVSNTHTKYILHYKILGHTWYQHSPVTCCVSSAGIENPAANFSCAATYRQIPALYVHYEHRLHPGYSCYY